MHEYHRAVIIKIYDDETMKVHLQLLIIHIPSIHIYNYLYTYVYVDMYVCIYVWICVCRYTCMYVWAGILY